MLHLIVAIVTFVGGVTIAANARRENRGAITTYYVLLGAALVLSGISLLAIHTGA